MKPKEGFLLREVDGTNLVVAVGRASLEFSGMITLNRVGAFLWKCLEKDPTEEALVAQVLAHYEVDEVRARTDVAAFLQKARDAGLLEG